MSDTVKRKLIEVALPLEAINRESAREKAIRHGHPSTIHLWWARRPLATCRAVIFASLVDDPSAHPDEFPSEEAQQKERERLFRILEQLCKWENSNDARVIESARAEILRSTNGNPPPIYDPFCGGGSIPLEAQRLGLQAIASDLNPIAVLINKCLLTLAPEVLDKPPSRPSNGKSSILNRWTGVSGLAEDVRFYGELIRERAIEQIGKYYPKASVPKELGGGSANVIAWLWARTVACPNPACGVRMPLVRSFVLSKKKAGKERYIEPILEPKDRRFSYRIVEGILPKGSASGTVNRKGAICLACQSPIAFDHIRKEGRAGRLDADLIAIVAEASKGRLFLPPTEEQSRIAKSAKPTWIPDSALPEQALGFRVQTYGITKHSDLCTPRQLLALTTYCNLVSEIRAEILENALHVSDLKVHADSYADIVTTFLALAVSKAVNRCTTIGTWMVSVECPGHMFTRQAIQMTWDYSEANVLTGPSGSFESMLENTIAGLISTSYQNVQLGKVMQLDATKLETNGERPCFSTDPPYYDNVPYADLSDVFYVWLRPMLMRVHPDLFTTLLVPKADELIAEPFRHGGKNESKEFFERGMTAVFERMRQSCNSEYPTTIYYAFKQVEGEEDESDDDSTDGSPSNRSSTGWETMLAALISAGWTVDGTWPMRTEREARTRNMDSNALASSIVLVCRPRPTSAMKTSRREFVACLKRELPVALRSLQLGNIAPVDLAQAAIGPGMAIFSRYSEVTESDGSKMNVRAALQIINQILDEVLSEQDSDYDADTRWAISWFEQNGFSEGQFGVAEVLSKAKDTAIGGLVEAGIVESKAGKVRLYKKSELAADWDPETDKRLTVWEITHHLMRALEEGGKSAAANLMRKVGGRAETAQELAYRLYGICERKKWAQDGIAYNSLVVSWPEIKAETVRVGAEPKQLLTSDI